MNQTMTHPTLDPSPMCASSPTTPRPNRESVLPGNPETICPFQQVPVPPDWTPEKDVQYYEAELGKPDGSYRADLFLGIREHDIELEEVFNRGIRLCLGRGKQVGEEAVRLLALSCKIELLKKLITENAPNEQYRRRFTADLRRCEQVLAFREEVLLKYLQAPDTVCLFELIEVHEWIATAWALLDESLWCEHETGMYQRVSNLPPREDW